MSDKHLQEIRSFYEALGPEDNGVGGSLDPDTKLSMISKAALETVPKEESISIHCSGSTMGPIAGSRYLLPIRQFASFKPGSSRKKKS